MGEANGFTYDVRGGQVVISHRRVVATHLRGDAARRFLADIDACGDQEAQQLMARVTGNYRRGNERAGKQSPRGRR